MPSLAAPRFDFERWFDDNGVRIITILVTAVVVTIVTRFLVRRFRRKLEGKPSLTQELNLQRATTLTHALSTAVVVVIWTLAFLLTLGTLEQMATDPGVRGVIRGMMIEAQSVGEAHGVRFEVDVETRIGWAADVGAHRTSMLQDLERGRPMEIDPLVTVVQEMGQLTAIPTPALDAVLALAVQRAKIAGLY